MFKRMQRLVLPLFILILIGTAFAYAEEDGSKDVANLNITIEQPVDLRCVYSEGHLYDAVRIDGKSLEEWSDIWHLSLDIKAVTKGPGEGAVTVKGINDYTGEVTIPAEFKFKPTKDEIWDQLNLKVVNNDQNVPYTGKTRDPVNKWCMDLFDYRDKLPEYCGSKS